MTGWTQSVELQTSSDQQALRLHLTIREFPYDRFQQPLRDGVGGAVTFEVRVLRSGPFSLFGLFRKTLVERAVVHRIRYDQFARELLVQSGDEEQTFESPTEALSSMTETDIVIPCEEFDCTRPVVVQARAVIEPSQPPGVSGVFGVLFRNRDATAWVDARP
jgi:hypothetical protein